MLTNFFVKTTNEESYRVGWGFCDDEGVDDANDAVLSAQIVALDAFEQSEVPADDEIEEASPPPVFPSSLSTLSPFSSGGFGCGSEGGGGTGD